MALEDLGDPSDANLEEMLDDDTDDGEGEGSSEGEDEGKDEEGEGDDEKDEEDEEGEGEKDDEEDDDEEKDDEEDEEDVDEDGKKKEKKEKKEKKDEKEEEEEEEDETDLDTSPHARPTIQQLKTAFPDLFKKFPGMRHMYFREKAYSEVFPAVEDAREAAGYAQTFIDVQDSLSKGDPEVLFKTMYQNDPANFAAVMENTLPTLWNEGPMGKELYSRIVEPVIINFIRGVHDAGEKQGGKEGANLKMSALWFSKHLTGKAELPAARVREQPRDDPERRRFEEEKSQFFTQRRNEFRSAVSEKGGKLFLKDIEKGLDPNNAMKPFVRKALRNEIFNEVKEALRADSGYMRRMESLWKQAEKTGYVGEQIKSQLISAFLGRARQLLVPIRQKARQGAMAGKSGDKKPIKKGLPNTSGASKGGKPSDKIDAKKVDWSKTSDMDILNDKVTTRK